jgi:hypothetical protein
VLIGSASARLEGDLASQDFQNISSHSLNFMIFLIGSSSNLVHAHEFDSLMIICQNSLRVGRLSLHLIEVVGPRIRFEYS